MIYEMLLIQDGGMSIPNGHFKRIKPSRDGPMPLSCSRCSKLFASDKDPLHLSHDKHYNVQHSRMSTSSSSILPELPAASPSILRTCRLVHLEALPILYTKNTFCFSDPATASTFCWKARSHTSDPGPGNCHQIVITALSCSRPMVKVCCEEIWSRARLPSSKTNDRRIGIEVHFVETEVLVRCYAAACSQKSRPRNPGAELAACRLLDEKLLEDLEPMVASSNDSQNMKQQVQKHITGIYRGSHHNSDENETFNATIWCGSSRAKAPCDLQKKHPKLKQ